MKGRITEIEKKKKWFLMFSVSKDFCIQKKRKIIRRENMRMEGQREREREREGGGGGEGEEIQKTGSEKQNRGGGGASWITH